MKIKLYAVKEIEVDENEPIIKEYIENNYGFVDDPCGYDVLDNFFKDKAKVDNTCMEKAPNADTWTLARAEEHTEFGIGTEDFIIWE